LGRPLDDEPDRAIVKRARALRGDVVDRADHGRRPPEDRSDLPLEEDLERFGDVTMTCHACGAELFDDVEMCYQCGAAVGPGSHEKRTPVWIIAIALLVIAALAGLTVLL
jgi:hypothetical protein